MYYAQMWDYGTDPNHVGVTGFLTCMGVVFASPNHLYAIHIPDVTAANPIGAAAFVAAVQAGEGVAHPAGTLHLFVNGMKRSTADDEARTMIAPLGLTEAIVYRLFAGLQQVGADSLAATAKVERVVGGTEFKFKHVPDNQWIPGGNARTGRYRGAAADTPTRPNNGELAAAWNTMDSANCSLRRVH